MTDNDQATYTKAMDGQTINASIFELTNQGSTAPIAAPVSYDEEAKEATLNPDADLGAGTTHTATFKSGANGAQDLADNLLENNMAWSFTTASPDTTS